MSESPRRHRPSRFPRPLPSRQALGEFLRNESIGGFALVIAAAIAILWANLGDSYFEFWHTGLELSLPHIQLPVDLHGWINDGLMVLFFFVVALEIKRELVTGGLNDRHRAALPVLAALGGAILPALIFLALVGDDEASRGWGIPMATDIAFAVGVLSLLGSRVPLGAKILLLSIAIVDDVIAIGVIALFYTDGLMPLWLLAAVFAWLGMVGMRRAGVASIAAYVPLGILIWLAVMQSGIHSTVAGVAIGLLTPAKPIQGRPVLDLIEQRLHPITSLLIVPLFALANAGIVFDSGVLRDTVTNSLAVAIGVALVAGKLIGISATIGLVTRLGLGRLPAGVQRRHVFGIAALSGIGFTVSLFIAQLSFTDPTTVDVAKLGIFSGSIVAAVLGSTILLRTSRRESDGPAP